MSNNPYAAPPNAGGAPNSAYAASKVAGPAIALMVISGLAIFLQIISLLMNLLGVGFGAAGAGAGNQAAGNEQMMAMMSGGLGIVFGIIGIAIEALILVGAMKMKKLESYGLAMTASIVAMLPCSACCVIGLPIGIWSLVVLNDPMVKSSFR